MASPFTPSSIPGVAWPVRSALAIAAAKFETFSRVIALDDLALTSQRIEVTAIELPSDTQITSIGFFATVGATTPANQVFGIYNSSRARLAVTADDTNTAWANNTTKVLALTAAYTTTYSGLYYLAVLVNAATAPSLACADIVSTLDGQPPILGGNCNTGVTALPDPLAAISTRAAISYGYVV